ncbi:MAG TPA: hypothetical protein DDZ88_28920 [Verrucomicrobiales bacterium]|nr:hypothetical protein [Verrucomicrobiales bacterium]
MSAFSYIVKNKGIRTALPFAAITLAPDAQGADGSNFTVDAEVHVCETPKTVPFAVQEASSTEQTLRLAMQIDKWTDQLEHSFVKLAKKEAVGQASVEESKELEHLESVRNRLKAPLKFEELVWQAKHEEAIQNLLKAMHGYLTVCAGPAWQGATRNR